MDEVVEVPFTEVGCVRCDMPKLVAACFGLSRTEAKRKIEAGAIAVIEARERKIELEKHSELFEYLLVYSKEINTYLKFGHRWKKVTFTP